MSEFVNLTVDITPLMGVEWFASKFMMQCLRLFVEALSLNVMYFSELVEMKSSRFCVFVLMRS